MGSKIFNYPQTKLDDGVKDIQNPVSALVENDKATHYEVLGVSITATVKDIEKAYRKQALVCHPDKNPNAKKKAERCMKRLSEAVAVLKNSSERRKYDNTIWVNRNFRWP